VKQLSERPKVWRTKQRHGSPDISRRSPARHGRPDISRRSSPLGSPCLSLLPVASSTCICPPTPCCSTRMNLSWSFRKFPPHRASPPCQFAVDLVLAYSVPHGAAMHVGDRAKFALWHETEVRHLSRAREPITREDCSALTALRLKSPSSDRRSARRTALAHGSIRQGRKRARHDLDVCDQSREPRLGFFFLTGAFLLQSGLRACGRSYHARSHRFAHASTPSLPEL
jgi:hypothetical protein